MAFSQQKKVGLVLAVVGWLLALGLTLYPTPEDAALAASTSTWCLVCGDTGMVDVTLNILLFVPLGLGLGLLGTGRWRAGIAIVLTTLAIEILQLSLIPGRDASLSDLITNTVGGVSGYAIGRHWRIVLFPRPRISFGIAAAGCVLWILVQTFTGWALQRTLPRSVYFGQWAPVLGQFQPFTGKVVTVRLDGNPVPGYRLTNSAEVRTALLAPESVLEARALTGFPTTDLAPIFSIFDDRQREIVLLGQDGNDLVYRIRTRTDQLRLRTPALRLRDVLPDQPGIRVELRTRSSPGRYHLEADIGAATFSQDLALSASWGWAFLVPFDHAFGGEMIWLTMLWVGGLLFLPAWYAARSEAVSRTTALLILGGILAAGLAAIPAAFHLAAFHPSEWLAGLVGAAAGWGLGNR